MSRRHLKGVLTIVSLLVAATLLRLALEWRQALSDIDEMIVTPVMLPEATAEAQATSDASVAQIETALRQSPEFIGPPTSSEATPGQGTTSAGASADEPPTLSGSGRPLNILLLGTDARPEDTSPTRTDAIVLVHLDRENDKVSMLSLPRDLWVSYPGGGEGRINAAYAIGEKRFGPGGGPALAKATVGRLLDLQVDHFVMINFQGFETLIDSLGGITVNVPHEIYDPAYPTADYKTMEVRFPEGPQRLSGEEALIYARTRHADNDFGRNQRQQQVLMAIFDRIRERGLLQQFTSLDEYTGALRGYVLTDINRSRMVEIGAWGRNISGRDISRFAIDSSVVAELKPPATFAADPEELERIVGQFTGEYVSQAGGE